MNRLITACLVAAGLAFAGPAQAQNKVIKIGDACPSFSSLPGADGKSYGLADLKKDVVVVVVTCNHCPVAVAYEDRIINFVKKFGDKVDVIAVNVNLLEQDLLPAMKVRAKDKGFNFAYVIDESQKLGKALGATVTPEFFVLDKARKIVYTGAFDNKQTGPTENYVEPAVEALLSGKQITNAQTKPFGCSVKYEK